MKKWEQLQLTFYNSKSEEGEGNYPIKWFKTVNESLSNWIWISTGFAQKRPMREFHFCNVINKDLHGV